MDNELYNKDKNTIYMKQWYKPEENENNTYPIIITFRANQ